MILRIDSCGGGRVGGDEPPHAGGAVGPTAGREEPDAALPRRTLCPARLLPSAAAGLGKCF